MKKLRRITHSLFICVMQLLAGVSILHAAEQSISFKYDDYGDDGILINEAIAKPRNGEVLQ